MDPLPPSEMIGDTFMKAWGVQDGPSTFPEGGTVAVDPRASRAP